MVHIPKLVKTLGNRFPELLPHLSGRARMYAIRPTEYKTYDYFLRELSRMVTNVYTGELGGEFIDIMASLIQGQINQAFEQAWKDEEGEGEIPEYLTSAAENMILDQYDFVDQYYRDIVDARVDKTPLEPLLSRASLWAQRWTEAYNEGVHLITVESGGNEIWLLGETEEHCDTCARLNGLVARASEWETLGVRPQNAPNELLECGGWRCDCRRESTDKRRSPRAFETIMNITGK